MAAGRCSTARRAHRLALRFALPPHFAAGHTCFSAPSACRITPCCSLRAAASACFSAAAWDEGWEAALVQAAAGRRRRERSCLAHNPALPQASHLGSGALDALADLSQPPLGLRNLRGARRQQAAGLGSWRLPQASSRAVCVAAAGTWGDPKHGPPSPARAPPPPPAAPPPPPRAPPRAPPGSPLRRGRGRRRRGRGASASAVPTIACKRAGGRSRRRNPCLHPHPAPPLPHSPSPFPSLRRLTALRACSLTRGVAVQQILVRQRRRARLRHHLEHLVLSQLRVGHGRRPPALPPALAGGRRGAGGGRGGFVEGPAGAGRWPCPGACLMPAPPSPPSPSPDSRPRVRACRRDTVPPKSLSRVARRTLCVSLWSSRGASMPPGRTMNVRHAARLQRLLRLALEDEHAAKEVEHARWEAHLAGAQRRDQHKLRHARRVGRLHQRRCARAVDAPRARQVGLRRPPPRTPRAPPSPAPAQSSRGARGRTRPPAGRVAGCEAALL